MVQYPHDLNQRTKNTVNLKRWIAALMVLLCLLTGACGPTEKAEAIQTDIVAASQEPTLVPLTAEPAQTAAPQSLTVAANTPAPTETPVPSPTPTATPLPTATPTASPIPFSYYAPTVNMSFEELVGGLEDSYYEMFRRSAN